MKEKIQNNVKNIILKSKIISNNKETIQIPGTSSKSLSLCSLIPCLSLYASRYPNFRVVRTLNDEVQIFELTSRRGDIATLRRRDVAELLTSALLTRRRDLVTSRRGDVATWQPLLALLCIAPQKLLLITALFTPLYLQPHQTQNQGSSHKNYKIHIK